jgi:hypothetical protein
MQEDPERQDSLATHIRAAARPTGESDRLTGALMAACWPSGCDDRSEPVARGWLKMWYPAHPTRIVVDVPACGCARGRCAICN